MSRHFEFDTADNIQFSAGPLSDADGGPLTVAQVIRFDNTSNFQRIVQARQTGGAEVWAVAIDSSQFFYATTAGFRNGPAGIATNTWYLYVTTKANGSAIVRDHLCNMATNVWTHADRGSALGDGTGPVNNIVCSTSDAKLDAYIAAIGVFKAVPANDAAVEALRSGIAAWQSAGFHTIWRFNDTPVNDLIGNANQTSISGTTVDTGVEPPSFSYTLGGAPVQVGAMAMFL